MDYVWIDESLARLKKNEEVCCGSDKSKTCHLTNLAREAGFNVKIKQNENEYIVYREYCTKI